MVRAKTCKKFARREIVGLIQNNNYLDDLFWYVKPTYKFKHILALTDKTLQQFFGATREDDSLQKENPHLPNTSIKFVQGIAED